MKTTLVPGARAYLDGRYLVVVKAAYPQGSSSFLFPHYKIDMVGGDRNVAVSMDRIGIDKKA